MPVGNGAKAAKQLLLFITEAAVFAKGQIYGTTSDLDVPNVQECSRLPVCLRLYAGRLQEMLVIIHRTLNTVEVMMR